MINKVIITFTNISRKIRLTKFSPKKKKRSTILVRGYYLWAPKSHQISHGFNVFVYSMAISVAYSIIIRTFLCSKLLSTLSTWNCVLPSINFLCFFLLDILFHFCFPPSSSSYINMCLNVHIHHSQFIVLFAIQSLLERF